MQLDFTIEFGRVIIKDTILTLRSYDTNLMRIDLATGFITLSPHWDCGRVALICNILGLRVSEIRRMIDNNEIVERIL